MTDEEVVIEEIVEETPPVPVRPEETHPSYNYEPVPPPPHDPFEAEEVEATIVLDDPEPVVDVPEPEEDAPTADEIEHNMILCGNSVDAINQIIAGTRGENDPQEERSESVGFNVKYLQIQESQQWYTDDSESRTAPADKASISAAITAGKAYMADNGFTYEDWA